VIDTFSSFVAGYAVAAALILAYVASLWLRARRLKNRLRARSAAGAGRLA
jgi:hypothetical protein